MLAYSTAWHNNLQLRKATEVNKASSCDLQPFLENVVAQYLPEKNTKISRSHFMKYSSDVRQRRKTTLMCSSYSSPRKRFSLGVVDKESKRSLLSHKSNLPILLRFPLSPPRLVNLSGENLSHARDAMQISDGGNSTVVSHFLQLEALRVLYEDYAFWIHVQSARKIEVLEHIPLWCVRAHLVDTKAFGTGFSRRTVALTQLHQCFMWIFFKPLYLRHDNGSSRSQ